VCITAHLVVMSGLTERALVADLSGTAAAVIEGRRFGAAQDAEHAGRGLLAGANDSAIAQVGFLAAFEQFAQPLAELEQLVTLVRALGECRPWTSGWSE